MTRIKATSKKQFEDLIRKYRNNGYNIITFTKKLVELESEDTFIVIER